MSVSQPASARLALFRVASSDAAFAADASSFDSVPRLGLANGTLIGERRVIRRRCQIRRLTPCASTAAPARRTAAGRPCAVCADDARCIECGGSGCRRDRGMTAIGVREQRRIPCGLLDMLLLQGSSAEHAVSRRPAFLRRRSCREVAGAAVVAHLIDGDVVDDRGVVRVVHHRDVDIGHRAVVGKRVAGPDSAGEAATDITETVVHAAVEADMWTPVTGMEGVHTSHESPVSGGPQDSHPGRLYPSARHPVITATTPGPVSRGPQITVLGAGRLVIVRQRWRGFAHPEVPLPPAQRKRPVAADLPPGPEQRSPPKPPPTLPGLRTGSRPPRRCRFGEKLRT